MRAVGAVLKVRGVATMMKLAAENERESRVNYAKYYIMLAFDVISLMCA